MKKFILFAFLITAIVCKAQPPGNFRYILFTGVTDSTTVPGVSNPLMGISGTMYYNTQSNKFRCFENGFWVDCFGGGGGGGGLVTASNMLSVSPAGNVISGGTATHNTFNHLGNFGIQWSSPTTKLALPPPSTNFPFTQSASFTVGDTTSSPTTNFARLYLENVPVGSPTAQLTSGDGSNQATVTLVPNSGTMQAGTTNHVTVGAVQSVLRNGNAQWVVSGANQRAELSSFVGGNSGLRFSVGSTSESVIQTIPSGDNLRFTTNNGNIVLDDPVILQQEPVQLDTATWFLARRHSDGAIVRRQSAGGGGGVTTADNGLQIDPVSSNVRIGTNTVPGEVTDDGAVFATDSLNTNFSTFRFAIDSVMIAHTIEEESQLEDSYLKLWNAQFIGAGQNGIKMRSQPTSNLWELTSMNGATRYYRLSSSQIDFGSTNFSSANKTIQAISSTGNAQLSLRSAGTEGVLLGNDVSATFLYYNASQNLLTTSGSFTTPFVFQTGDRTGVSNPDGNDFTIRAGNGSTSVDSDGGNLTLRSGAHNGTGVDGNITIDALTGFIILNPSSIPTTNPCGTAPPGTIWSDSGVLNMCP